MILLIDNYDSFSYNLFQLIGEIEPNIKVIRNDEMTVEEIKTLNPDRIILSLGPGRPEDAGIIIDAAKMLGKDIPILGVCLGHQAICAAFGATVTYAKELMHGKQSDVKFDTDCPLFAGCPEAAPVARYHSLAADADTMPECLKVTALTTDGEVMAVQHKEYPIYSVQFHPESIMTPNGKQMALCDTRESFNAVAENMPSWKVKYYHDVDKIMEINVPVVNIGAFGRDGHMLTERVDMPQTFRNVPNIAYEAIVDMLK